MKRNFIILFVLLSITILVSITQYKQDIIEKQLSSITDKYHRAFQTVYDHRKQLAYVLFTGLSKISNIEGMLYKASTVDQSQLPSIRNEIYESLRTRYKQLHALGLRQMLVYSPDGEVILRMHKPESYGDNLTKIRPSVKYISDIHLAIHTFEEGVYYYGFRSIFPLFHNQKYVGALELAFGANMITSAIMNEYNVLSNFYIKSTIMNENKVQFKNTIYRISHHEGYYYDKEVLQEIKKVARKDIEKLKPSKSMTSKIRSIGKGKKPSIYL